MYSASVNDPYLQTLRPLYIFGTVEARNLEFGIQTDHGNYFATNDKLRWKKVWSASRNPAFQIWVT